VAQTLPKLNVGVNASDDVTPVLWARDTGMFTRAGLDVEIQKFTAGSTITAAVIGGSLDIGRSSLLPLIEARARGIPVQLIVPDAVSIASNAADGIVVAKNSSIASGKDLNGATLPVPSINDFNTIATRAWIDQTGGDSKTVHFVELPISSIIPAILDRRVPAGLVTNPSLAKGLADGTIKVIGRPDQAIAKRFLITAYFSTESFISTHGGAIAAFSRVLLSSNAYTNVHHAEAVVKVAPFWGINASVIENETTPLAAVRFDPADIQPLIDVASRYGVLSKPLDAATLVAPTVQQPK
jgi:NitT/TauT family transport system substrate-binding protein